MKEAIGAFLVALVISCAINGLTMEAQPYPWPVGLNDVRESSFGLKREEGAIPEINYTDGARKSRYMTRIDEGTTGWNVEWPLAANN